MILTKKEILKLLDEDEAIKDKINEYLLEVEQLEAQYVELIEDLTEKDV